MTTRLSLRQKNENIRILRGSILFTWCADGILQQPDYAQMYRKPVAGDVIIMMGFR